MLRFLLKYYQKYYQQNKQLEEIEEEIEDLNLSNSNVKVPTSRNSILDIHFGS